MHKYEIIVYWSNDDDSYVAEVPELLGCMADGNSYIEALTNVQSIINEWLEVAHDIGRDIPFPKGKLAYA